MTATAATAALFRAVLEDARSPTLRPVSQWACDEIVFPTGPLATRRYTFDSQPYQRLLFAELESGRWSSIVILGPSQSGKSFLLVLIVLYAIFELREDVIVGVPDMNLADSKWSRDFLPVIMASRYASEIPDVGDGARGGKVKMVVFRNGRSLTFLSGGTGDAGRAGYTAPGVYITEADQLDEAGGTSREGTKIDQLKARTRAFEAAGRRRFVAESTVSIETGFVWRMWQANGRPKIHMPCASCGEYVHHERQHLVGWQDASTATEARKRGALSCPSCGSMWTESERREAARASVLVHGSQTIDSDGEVRGPQPEGGTLAFRWTSADNMFADAGAMAAEEWEARQRPDTEEADTTIRQQVWTMPPEPRRKQVSDLRTEEIAARSTAEPRRVCPMRSEAITVGVDVGKRRIHWVLVAWTSDASGHVLDYGETPVRWEALGEERSILDALRVVRDEVIPRSLPSADGVEIPVRRVFVDSSYQTKTIYEFTRESDPAVWLAVMGYGAGEEGRSYKAPSADRKDVVTIGDGYHVHLQRSGAQADRLGNLDADLWKSFVHARLTTPASEPGAMTFYRGTTGEHMGIARHLTAETKIEEFRAGAKGLVISWRQDRPENHYFDCLYYASAAAHLAGVRVTSPRKRPVVRVAGYAKRDGDGNNARGGGWKIGR